VTAALCEHCGNCGALSLQAIVLDARGVPVFDAARCVRLLAVRAEVLHRALAMRERTAGERAALAEA